MAANLAALSSTGPTPKGLSRRRESVVESGLSHLPSRQAISDQPTLRQNPPSALHLFSRKGDIQRMKPCPSARPGTQGQGRGITQVAAQRNLGKPLTARGAELLSRLVSQWEDPPVPARRIRGRKAPQDWSGWNGMNREEPERFHGVRANNRREGAVDMDPSGAEERGLEIPLQEKGGAPNSVGAGESPVPGMSQPEPENTGDCLQAWGECQQKLPTFLI